MLVGDMKDISRWIHVAYVRGRENERQLKYKPVGGAVRRMAYKDILEKF